MKPTAKRKRRLQAWQLPCQMLIERLEDRALLAAPQLANPIADQSAAILTPFSFSIPGNTFSDADSGDTQALSATGLPAWLTFLPGVGKFFGTPSATDVGTSLITVTTTDSTSLTANDTFALTVQPNVQPSFTINADPSPINEDATPQPAIVTTLATNISAGESGQTVMFDVVSVSNPSLLVGGAVSISPNGTLTYTPAADASGTTNVTVRLLDNGGTTGGGLDASISHTFKITVNAVNDAPRFTKGGDQTVETNSGPQSIGNWATEISRGPADESGQRLNFVIVNNSNDKLFSVQPAISADGTLTFSPMANGFGGTAVITVKLSDNGGTANGGVDTSAEQTFEITTFARHVTYASIKNAQIKATVVDGKLQVRIGTGKNNLVTDYVHPELIETITFLGGSRADEINLSGLSATLYASLENVAINTGAGNDKIVGSFTNDSIVGGTGNDTIIGGLGDDSIDGGGGTDLLIESGNVSFTLDNSSLAGLGADSVRSMEKVSLAGGVGNNKLDASAFTWGTVTLLGGAGNDTLIGGSQNDAISGQDGNDLLSGGTGHDTLLGGLGDDTLAGDMGNDLLIGGFDDDSINGGLGRDTVVGGQGGAARGGAGVQDPGDVIAGHEVISETFKKRFAFE